MLCSVILFLCAVSDTQSGTVFQELAAKQEYSTSKVLQMLSACFLEQGRCNRPALSKNSCAKISHLLMFLAQQNRTKSQFLEWLPKETKDIMGENSVLVTAFAPTNDACTNFMKNQPSISKNIYWLNVIAIRSLVWGNFTLAELKEKGSIERGLHVWKLWFSGWGRSTYINNAKSVSSIVASNGQIHEIDAVIYPLSLAGTLKDEINIGSKYSGLKSLLAIATDAGDVLDNATAKFTVFSPNAEVVTDATKAMSSSHRFPTDVFATSYWLLVIRHHIVRDQVIFSRILKNQISPLPTLHQGAKIDVKVIDNSVFVGFGGYWSMVESFDVSTTNGVIHVINGILGMKSGVNVYQALRLFASEFHSNFDTTLRKISTSQELKRDLMDTTMMYTIFSPHNTAWTNLSTSDVISIEKDLKRHVITRSVTAAELKSETELTTMSGEKLTVKNENGKACLKFDNVQAEIISTDNMASNGIIHVIDKVLMKTSGAGFNCVCLSAVIGSLALIFFDLDLMYLIEISNSVPLQLM